MKFLSGFLVGFGVAAYLLGTWVYLELQRMFVMEITNSGLAGLMIAFPAALILIGAALTLRAGKLR